MKLIQDRKIRIGLVGCGRIAKNHIEAILEKKEDLDLVAVCDSNPTILDQMILNPEPQKYLDLEEMFSQEDLDLIVLCTPSGLHSSQTILAAEYGKNVLTEKPMATAWADGLAMVNACEHAGTDLFIVKQNRLNPTVGLVKQSIDKGHFGRIYMLSSNVFWARPQSYYDQAPWRGTWHLDGGALMNKPVIMWI
jgi:UDP-N-acetyl-2-amino-2-deoxyglucuronate dehydrogenase